MDNSNDIYLRQRGILSPLDLLGVEITQIGVGGIGSPTALILSKMGFPKLTIYDPDQVEMHNLSNQIFRVFDLHRSKVDALSEVISEYSPNMTVVKFCEKFDETSTPHGIVISAVDSMASRLTIWNSVKKNGTPFYVEARMGAEFARVYSFIPSDTQLATWYEQMLYSDEEAVNDPCTERAIMYTVMVIGGLIANQIKKHVKGEEVKKELLVDLKNLALVVQ